MTVSEFKKDYLYKVEDFGVTRYFIVISDSPKIIGDSVEIFYFKENKKTYRFKWLNNKELPYIFEIGHKDDYPEYFI